MESMLAIACDSGDDRAEVLVTLPDDKVRVSLKKGEAGSLLW